MGSLTTSVGSIHWEDFSGKQFERLVFAYFLRTDNWHSIEWLGEGGKEQGRDIIGFKKKDGCPTGQVVCIQCANWVKPSVTKIKNDVDKILKSATGTPDVFYAIAGGSFSPKQRDKIKLYCISKGIYESYVWSGAEFEERLRSTTESLLKRFFDGEEFPDSSADLKKFVFSIKAEDDHEVLSLMAMAFERPAFYTPFGKESSIPAFKQAITDTIQLLGTGIQQVRDGTPIRRIPSRHDLKSLKFKKVLAGIETKLAELRFKFEEFVNNGEIRFCGCDNPHCHTYFASDPASEVMDFLRNDILSDFSSIYPAFKVRVGFRH